MRALHWTLLGLVCSSTGLMAASPTKITLATTDWCPYACDGNPSKPGFVVEYMKEVFLKQKIQLEVKSFPWARAIQLAKSGKVDGLLTAASSELDGLTPTTTPTGTYKVCFYTHTDSKWIYKNFASLKDIQLGILADYSYGEPVDTHIRKESESSKLLVKTAGGDLAKLLEMIVSKRLDATLDDESVVDNVALKNKIDMSKARKAGCLESIPYFMGFNPKLTGVKALVTTLNQELGKAENTARYSRLLEQYTRSK